MWMHLRTSLAWAWVVLGAATAAAESPNRIVVPLSDPGRPAALRVELIRGGIQVTGYGGKEIVVEADVQKDAEGDEDVVPAPPEPPTPPPPGHRTSRATEDDERDEEHDERARGLRRIPNLSAGLSVSENDNEVSVEGSPRRSLALAILVPAGTSLYLSTVTDGDIVVRDLQAGEIEIENTNGEVRLERVAGPVTVHALNGDIDAKLARLDPRKASSFSTFNGDIDVTLPPDVKADVRIKSDNGEIYTDFDVQMGTRTERREGEDEAATDRPRARKYGKRGKGRAFGFESAMTATLGGGGPLLRFETFNGNVYIRKAK
jgi:hypothetical protein